MSSLTLAALALIGYTVAGYPLLLAVAARAREARPRRSSAPPVDDGRPYEPAVSVCLAVQNGAEGLDAKLESLLALDYPSQKLEILVYCDGSTDGSDAIVQRFADRDLRVRPIHCATRVGKSLALNRLAAAALGEILLMTDDAQPLAPDALRAVLAELRDPDVGCVSGRVEVAGRADSGALWRYEKLIRSYEARLGTVVGVTGSLYALRKRDFPKLPLDVTVDTAWVPLSLALAHKRVVLCDRAVAYDRPSSVGGELERTVRTLAGNYSLFARRPALLSPFDNQAWFATYSHKLLRLLCPWLLVILFAQSWYGAVVSPPEAMLEQMLLRALLLAQLLLCASALLGSRLGALGTLSRSFVLMNVATVLAFFRFLRQSRQQAAHGRA